MSAILTADVRPRWRPRLGHTSQAAAWTFFAFGAMQVLRLACNVLLAHLLFPEAFGLTALTGTILTGLQMFSDVGLVPSLIRSPRGEEPVFRQTAWTLGVIQGLLVWAITVAIAIPVGQFYDPQLTPLLPVVGATAFIAALGSTSVAVLGRHMQLRGITLLDLGSTLIGLAVTCVWALIHPTVWAIVGGGLVVAAVKSAGSWMLVPGYRDRFRLERAAVCEIIGFGRWILVSTIITFIALQADRLILGKLLTLDQVGVYSIALSLVLMPRDLIGRLAGSVQYPLLARCVLERPEQLWQSVARTRTALLLVAQWSLLAIALGAQGFFTLLYDARYAKAIELAPWLSVSAFIWMLSISADRTLLAVGDSRSLAATNFARATSVIPACLFGFSWYGLPGFVGGLVLSASAGHLVLVYTLLRHGVNIVGGDLRHLATFVLLLVGPIVLANRMASLGTVRGVDVGQALLGALVLVPLGIAAAFKMKTILRK